MIPSSCAFVCIPCSVLQDNIFHKEGSRYLWTTHIMDVLSFGLDGSLMMTMKTVAGLKPCPQVKIFIAQATLRETVSELTSSIWLSEGLLVSF